MNSKMLMVAILINLIFLAYSFVGPQLPARVVYLEKPPAAQSKIAIGGVVNVCGEKSPIPAGNAANWSCQGDTATYPVSDGFYVPTNFGCSKGFPKDPNDNCQPACGAIPECAGITGQACEEKIQWFAANSDQYGCNAKVKATNPMTGKAVVVRVIDKGPACSVQQSGRGKFDLSEAAYVAIGAVNMVKIDKVDDATPLGPIAACTP